MSISERLTQLRDSRGWTQDQVADKLNIKRARYSSWENAIAKPDIEFVSKLSELYNVSSDYIIKGKEHDIPSWATSKDVRDFKSMLEHEGDIMFDGIPIEGAARQRVMDVLTGLFWEAKQMNKTTYGRKKTDNDDK